MVTKDQVILAVGNSTDPAILFMNYEMELIQSFPIDVQDKHQINLAMYQPDNSTIMQLMYSTNESISII